jgi:Secretion system C-terminal sorting domain
MNKPVGIEPGQTLEEKTKYGPNPVDNSLHLFYKSNLSNNAYMTLTTLDGKPIMRQKINGATEGDLDMTKDKPGMYILQIINETKIQRIIFIKE